MRSNASLIFIAHTVLCQAITVALVVITWPVVQNFTLVVAIGAATSLIVASILKLPMPWRVLNAILPLGAAISLNIELPHWIFLAIFIALICVYAPAFMTRVPYYPTPKAAYSLILAELPTDRPFTFVDIGCGFGDLLFFLSKYRPNGQFVGLEIGFLPWLVGYLRSYRHMGQRVSIQCKNMWRVPLDDFDVVYTFLSPAPMAQMWDKVSREMKHGSLFITNTFEVPAPATEILTVKDSRCSRLFFHKIER